MLAVLEFSGGCEILTFIKCRKEQFVKFGKDIVKKVVDLEERRWRFMKFGGEIKCLGEICKMGEKRRGKWL